MTMTTAMVWPDIELLVGDFLDARIGVPVHATVPNPRPAAFVTVRRVGGAAKSVVSDEPRIVWEAWGADDDEAAELGTRVRTILQLLKGHRVDGCSVYRVDEISGGGRLPDPLSGQSRVTGSALIHVRGTPYVQVQSG